MLIKLLLMFMRYDLWYMSDKKTIEEHIADIAEVIEESERRIEKSQKTIQKSLEKLNKAKKLKKTNPKASPKSSWYLPFGRPDRKMCAL